jgi:hypothetical protein
MPDLTALATAEHVRYRTALYWTWLALAASLITFFIGGIFGYGTAICNLAAIAACGLAGGAGVMTRRTNRRRR